MIHPVLKWMAATLDGMVEPGGAFFEAKFMLPPAATVGSRRAGATQTH